MPNSESNTFFTLIGSGRPAQHIAFAASQAISTG
jgi:hypothetical protein